MQLFVYRKAAPGEESEGGVVAICLRDEIELLQQTVANLETLLQTEWRLTPELRRTNKLFKKLELLRLFARAAREL